ncbi:MAG: polysaccharide deacetylase family protein [Chloroflexi bacterium]|nr:polysaccharide deacetylase family protein [Chloroflexota bacterium]
MRWRIVFAAGIGALAGRRAVNTWRALNRWRVPSFVRADLGPDDIGVPVFTYHSVADAATPDAVSLAAFERHMRYLAENGYHTLSADELHDHLVESRPIPRKTVVITFDDGRATLWTAAFPLLQQYAMRAVCFLIPGTMPEAGVRSTLADVRAGRDGSLEAVLAADRSACPSITWQEARLMHDSGLIDFQSHSLHHTLIFTGPAIVDFVHPAFDAGYASVHIPAIRQAGTDYIRERPPLGTPIYRSQPRLGAACRFFDDEGLRQACIETVNAGGGRAFFERADWRGTLSQMASAYRHQHALAETFESPQEQADAIRHSLAHSRNLIEEHLAGHRVRHLCYPWHHYSILAASLAREVGYISAFTAINQQKLAPCWNDPYAIQRLVPINEPGDDPYQITRIDARNDIILSLPGNGRRIYSRRVAARLFRLAVWGRG